MPVRYASFSELETRLGVDYLREKTPRPSGFDPETPTWTHVQPYWESILDEASLEIDLSLRRAGYPAPCVSSGSTIVTTAVEQLRAWCLALALANGQISNVGEGNPIAAAAERAREQLKALVRGSIRLDATLSAAIAGKAVYPRTSPTNAEPFAELGRAVARHRSAPE